MSEQKQKTYINGIILKRRKIGDGPPILKVSVKVDDFIKELQQHRKADGWINFDIKARKEVKENGESHYAVLDTWMPAKKETSSQTSATPTSKSSDNDF